MFLFKIPFPVNFKVSNSLSWEKSALPNFYSSFLSALSTLPTIHGPLQESFKVKCQFCNYCFN